MPLMAVCCPPPSYSSGAGDLVGVCRALALLSFAGRVEGGRVGVATHTGVTAAPLAEEDLLTGPATGAPNRLLPAEPCILTLRFSAAVLVGVLSRSRGCRVHVRLR